MLCRDLVLWFSLLCFSFAVAQDVYDRRRAFAQDRDDKYEGFRIRRLAQSTSTRTSTTSSITSSTTRSSSQATTTSTTKSSSRSTTSTSSSSSRSSSSRTTSTTSTTSTKSSSTSSTKTSSPTRTTSPTKTASTASTSKSSSTTSTASRRSSSTSTKTSSKTASRTPKATGCIPTDLALNGGFEKDLSSWTIDEGSIGATNFYWAPNSAQEPSHSGSGQNVLFMPRRGGNNYLRQDGLPGYPLGEKANVTVWVRFGTDQDASYCFSYLTGNNQFVDFKPTSQWTPVVFEDSGTGRDSRIFMSVSCENNPAPIRLYIDDITYETCLPRKINPQCQVQSADGNLLLDGGFECPGSVIGDYTNWISQPYRDSDEHLFKGVSTPKNETHSGTGMGVIKLEGTEPSDYFYGLSITQQFQDDEAIQTYKFHMWLRTDARRGNTRGCQMSVSFRDSRPKNLQDIPLGSLPSDKWVKFSARHLPGSGFNNVEIQFVGCKAKTLPVFYIDDVYYGVDKHAKTPSASSSLPTPTSDEGPTSTVPCTTTPTLADPDFEVGNIYEWAFNSQYPSFEEDLASTYAAPHSGSGSGVFVIPPSSDAPYIIQTAYGFCPSQTYSMTVWFLIPSGIDASTCVFRIACFASSSITINQTNTWVSNTISFASDRDSNFMSISASCTGNTRDVVVLIDDITFGAAESCTGSPSVPEGGFESANSSIWDPSFLEGDETMTFTSLSNNPPPHSGLYSARLLFPSTNNAILLSQMSILDFCPGARYRASMWYYMPSKYKGISCSLSLLFGPTLEGDAAYMETDPRFANVVYDAWTEISYQFVAAAAEQLVYVSSYCSTRAQSVEIWIDDVEVQVLG